MDHVKMNANKSIDVLVRETVLEELALPSNLRYGHSIYARKAVEFIKRSDILI